MLMALEYFIEQKCDPEKKQISKKEAKQDYVVLKVNMHKFLERPEECYPFSEMLMYDMVTYCTEIGPAATPGKENCLQRYDAGKRVGCIPGKLGLYCRIHAVNSEVSFKRHPRRF